MQQKPSPVEIANDVFKKLSDAHTPNLAGAVAQAGVDPTLECRDLQDALRSSIGSRRGYSDCTGDQAGADR